MILMKAPYLSNREMSIYKRHCQAGASMLENIQGFSHIIPIIHAHHEKWDGTGYPKRLKGVNIPLGARIISVADHYDKFINPCIQQWQKTHSEAIIELQNKAGLDFDPNVVKAFMQSVIPSKVTKTKNNCITYLLSATGSKFFIAPRHNFRYCCKTPDHRPRQPRPPSKL